VEALIEYGPAAPVDPMIERLRDEDRAVRSAAAKALGGIGGAEAVRALVQALDDPEWEVCRDSILALGKSRDPAAVPPLVELLLSDEHTQLRRWAADSLGAIGHGAAVAGLAEASQGNNETVRSSAFDALARIGGAAATAAILEVLRSPQGKDRSKAVQTLGKLKDQATIPDLLAAVRDEDRDVRCCAAGVLGELKIEAAVPVLIEALQDSLEDVRRAAKRSLWEIGTPEARAAIKPSRLSRSNKA
jgi:HEAT repeat protein